MEISSYSHSRRNFVKKMGFLSISFSWVMESCTKGTEPKVPENVEFLPLNYPVKPNQNQVDAWIRVYENGLVEVLTGKIELGQGIRTAVSQMAAEELNTSIDKIRVSMAETGYSPAEGYTAGSRSIETSAMSVRNAAATARVKLLRLASDKFGIELDKLKIADGEIVTPKEKLSFFDLLEGKQIEDTIEENPPLFADSVRKYVGQPIPRKDIEKMVRGKLEYVHDLRFTGMLHARIVRPPAYKAELSSFDEDILKNESGLNIIRKGSFLAVVCEDEYHCITAVKKASQKAVWNYKDTLPGKVPLKDFLRNMETENQTEEDTGNYKKALEEASITHKATYFKPYIMHASNGPACAVAKFENGKFDIWCHSQGVYPLRASLAELFKIKEEDIHIKGMHGSGMYGHNSADDAAAEAALIAREIPGKHIRVQWSREEENAWEPYGTAMLMDVEAGLDKDGKIMGWKYEVWTDGHSSRPGGPPDCLLPAWYIGEGYSRQEGGYRGGGVRNSQPYYEIGSLRVDSHFFDGPLRVSSLRGLGAYANIFAIESFMDELADLAGTDSLEFRLKHSTDPRALACIEKIREITREVKVGNKEGIGYSFSRYKNTTSYCAVAARVKEGKGGAIHVLEMWAVIDAGEVINPDGLRNITEGGMIQSISWAMKEQVKYNNTHVTSLDWVSYPILRMDEVPQLHVEIIERAGEPAMGAGEAVQAPATAALANAVFRATGKRVRDLPFNAFNIL